MKRALVSTLALAIPALASAAGGGGVTLGGTFIPQYGSTTYDPAAPGWVGCIGGIGYGAFKNGFRLGGEGAYCADDDKLVQASYGGAQLGYWKGSRWLFWSAYASLGGGVFNDETTAPNVSDYRSIYLYAKPTIAAGVALGPTALELGVFAMVPVNIVQDVGNGDSRGIVTPTVGVQASFLFGWFKEKKRKPTYDVAPPPPPPAEPLYVPPPTPTSPQPVVPPVNVIVPEAQPVAPYVEAPVEVEQEAPVDIVVEQEAAPITVEQKTVCPPCNCNVNVEAPTLTCGDNDVSIGNVDIGGIQQDVQVEKTTVVPQDVTPPRALPEIQFYDEWTGEAEDDEDETIPEVEEAESEADDDLEVEDVEARPLALPAPR